MTRQTEAADIAAHGAIEEVILRVCERAGRTDDPVVNSHNEEKSARNRAIVILRDRGESLAAIAAAFEISRERVGQICHRHDTKRNKQIEPPATVATRSTGNGASEPSARRDDAAGAQTSPDLLDEAMARTYGSAPSHGGRR